MKSGSWHEIGFPRPPMSSWIRWRKNDRGSVVFLNSTPIWVKEHTKFIGSDDYRYPFARAICGAPIWSKEECLLCGDPQWSDSIVGFLTCISRDCLDIESDGYEDDTILASVRDYIRLFPIYDEDTIEELRLLVSTFGDLYGLQVCVDLTVKPSFDSVRRLSNDDIRSLVPDGYPGIDFDTVLKPSAPNLTRPCKDPFIVCTGDPYSKTETGIHHAFADRNGNIRILKVVSDFLTVVPTESSMIFVDGKIVSDPTRVTRANSVVIEDVSGITPIERMLRCAGPIEDVG